MPNAGQMERRQKVLADFGEFALRSDDLDAVLTEACRLVAEALGTGRAKVLQIEGEKRTLFLRSGIGWDEGVVGRVRLAMDEHSSETYSIAARQPVITNDLASENRFDVPAFMKEAGVRALANVPIFLPGGRAFGLLQVDATQPRAFGDEDTQFLRTYATILGPVIDRLLQLQVLGATEERFRAIVDAARDYAIVLTDLEDRITDWLAGAESVFGWTAAEVIGQPAAILFTPEDRQAGVPEAELAAARDGGSTPDVRWHLRKDGTRVFVEGTVVALRDPSGGLRGYQKIGQNVTKRRLAEEALRESEARHSLLIGSWAQAVWETDASGVVVTDSPSWRAYTGQTLKEWLGYGWLDAIHPDDRAYAERNWREAVAARTLVDAEFRIRAAGGEWRWTNVRAAPVLDAAGNIKKWAGMNIDIDSRKLAEDALRESEAKFRTLFEAMDEGFGICELVRDANGRAVDYRYIEVNPAVVRHVQIPPETLQGRLASEVFSKLDPWLLETYARVVDEGQSIVTDHYFPHVDRWLHINVFPRGGNRIAAKAAFETHAEESQGQVERLERVFEIIGKPARSKTCEGMQGLTAEMQETLEDFKGSPAADAVLIGAAQAIEHYEIARYGTLKTWAMRLGQEDAAKLLEETLGEEKKTDELLTRIAGEVNSQAELEDEGEELEAPRSRKAAGGQGRK